MKIKTLPHNLYIDELSPFNDLNVLAL